MDPETTPQTPETVLDTWAVLSLLGHNRIAGKVTSVSICGAGMLRVDIPAHGGFAAHTRFVNPKSLYDLQPCDEAAARAYLPHCNSSPVLCILAANWRDEQRAAAAALPSSEVPHGDYSSHLDNDDDGDDDGNEWP